MSLKEIFLEGNPPWGFRMNGGADAGHSLRISRVNPGSKAEGKGVREGDLITSINGQSTKCLTNSESHALLRTVKENLLLGLNEDKNASPRRRSREIKCASIIREEKDRCDSAAQCQGNKKTSANQKRHQRRTRLKHRIKEMFGLKTKEKSEQDDEDWVIIDSSLKSETKSMSSSLLDEELDGNFTRSSSEPVSNGNEEVYDNYEFKSLKQYSVSDIVAVPEKNSLSSDKTACCQCITPVVYNLELTHAKENQKSKQRMYDYENEIYIHQHPVAMENVKDNNSGPILCTENSVNKEIVEDARKKASVEVVPEKCALEVHIIEGDGLSEMLKILPPNEMVEVCNATIMIEDDINASSVNLSNPIISLVDTEQSHIAQSPNPDYEPVEVNSSVIIYPPYNSTLNYYFPQRRFLEAIVEENSDLSENNEEKHEKPWENSQLIREANNIESIPNDWFGSDDGIDTSWRDGKSIEELSDVPIVTDSLSDSEFLSQDNKTNKGFEESSFRRGVSSKGRVKENDGVLGKPPINVINTYRISEKQPNKSFLVTKTESHTFPSVETVRDSLDSKSERATLVDPYVNKVTCQLLKDCDSHKYDSSHISENSSENKSRGNTRNGEVQKYQVQGTTKAQIQESSEGRKSDGTKLSIFHVQKNFDSGESTQKVVKLSIPEQKNQSHFLNKEPSFQELLEKNTSTDSRKYIKTTPSASVLKNVVSSYYNNIVMPTKLNVAEHIDGKKSKTNIELSTALVEPGLEKDIEFIYIDSSDSDAFSNKSNLSASNRTSLSLEKEEEDILGTIENNVTVSKGSQVSSNSGHIIKEVITNINQSVKEISDICCDSPKPIKYRVTPTLKSKANDLIKHNILPNLLSPVLARKCRPNQENIYKRRFSYPFSENDILKNYNTISCCQLKTSIDSDKYDANCDLYSTLKLASNEPKSSEQSITKVVPSEESNRKLSLFSSKGDAKSSDSVFLDFSDGSVSSESYTLPDVTHENELLSDVSTDTITYLGIPPSSPGFVPRSPVAVSDIVDLHKKFVERRGYHEASPALRKNKEDEPDLIALSKCQDRREQAYTPELLAEAANLLALHKYHQSRQNKMRQGSNEKPKETAIHSDVSVCLKNGKQSTRDEIDQQPNMNESEDKIQVSAEPVVNEISEEDNRPNKSSPSEKKTVGKSRLLELFQKLELKSSASECTHPEPFPYWLILESLALDDAKQLANNPSIPLHPLNENQVQCAHQATENSKSHEELEGSNSCSGNVKKSSVTVKCEKITTSTEAKPLSLPIGEVFQRKMYEEYLGKIAELAERRSSKVIKISSVTNSVNPCCENQPLESEFMSKLKERNEKLGIVIESEESGEKSKEPAAAIHDLPKHLKELMEITEECGGVWSPAQTPEAERKKFDFSSEIKEDKEKKEEPQPAVWTPRSAGASPTLERKFRAVNFHSPPPARKEIKTSNEETPELPQDIPAVSDKDTKSRLTSSSSENSTLSSSLRLPAAQNPTITLLQKAREGQIPRGAQYLEDQPIISPNDIIYSVKKEHVSDDQCKKIIELGPRKIEGIGPITKEGIPTVLRSEVKEDNQQRWYKRMYDSLHKADYDKDFVTVKYKTKRRGQYPYTYTGGYSSEPERVGYDSDASLSKYATLDRRKIRNKENDFTTSTMPRNRYGPGAKFAVNVYKNQPGRIEDYEPGHSSIAEKETKQWWDDVMDIFDGELNDHSRYNHASKTNRKPFTYSLKDAGYESDSTLVFKRRENNMSEQFVSPAEQKMAYKVIQKGGEVPLQGLRKAAPERPKEPVGNPIPTPPRDSTSRQRIQESPHRYVESEVNIHYRSPVRREAKAAWPEDELAQRQAEIMRRIYQEQKRTKYLNELHDMYSRRHADNLLPSQKSPIPLNRYDDFPVEVQPPRPRDRTPEPKLVARALYNFVGQTSRELSFRRGDIIYVRRQIDKNWYEGEHNAMVGLFPFNYVEIIPYDGIRTLPKKANEGQARAKFNFQAQTHLELSLVKGELVLLTRRVDENWFEGRIGKRKGIFPVSYVEVLVEPGERAVSPSSGSSPSKPIVAPASHSVMLNGAKDLGQQHYQPPRPAIYASSLLPPSNKLHDISLVNQTLHIDTQSDPVPYRVMYNYRPQNEDELELKEGDVVYVMEKCDDGWYVGSLHRNGQFGTFPGNYVERIQ